MNFWGIKSASASSDELKIIYQGLLKGAVRYFALGEKYTPPLPNTKESFKALWQSYFFKRHLSPLLVGEALLDAEVCLPPSFEKRLRNLQQAGKNRFAILNRDAHRKRMGISPM